MMVDNGWVLAGWLSKQVPLFHSTPKHGFWIGRKECEPQHCYCMLLHIVSSLSLPLCVIWSIDFCLLSGVNGNKA